MKTNNLLVVILIISILYLASSQLVCSPSAPTGCASCSVSNGLLCISCQIGYLFTNPSNCISCNRGNPGAISCGTFFFY